MPSGGGVNVENRMWGQFDVAVEPALTVGSVGIQEVHDTRGMPTVYNVPSVQMTDVMNRYSFLLLFRYEICFVTHSPHND